MTTPLSAEGLEACWVFGSAAIAVMEVRDRVRHRGCQSALVADAYAELLDAHDALRRRFADGTVEGITEMALSVLVLAERARMLLS